jgi:ATP-dependent exoDNAse (exonuclease V) alpha subunit
MMSRTTQKAEIAAELAELSRQQAKAIHDATYLGWRDSERAAYDKRSDRIALLRDQIAALNSADDDFDLPALPRPAISTTSS